MKRLLAILTTSLVFMPEVAQAKGKVAGSCAQAVSEATFNTQKYSVVLVIVILFGVYVMSNVMSHRRRDKELKNLTGGLPAKTSIFGQPT